MAKRAIDSGRLIRSMEDYDRIVGSSSSRSTAKKAREVPGAVGRRVADTILRRIDEQIRNAER